MRLHVSCWLACVLRYGSLVSAKDLKLAQKNYNLFCLLYHCCLKWRVLLRIFHQFYYYYLFTFGHIFGPPKGNRRPAPIPAPLLVVAKSQNASWDMTLPEIQSFVHSYQVNLTFQREAGGDDRFVENIFF